MADKQDKNIVAQDQGNSHEEVAPIEEVGQAEAAPAENLNSGEAPKRKKTKAELTMFIISIVLLCLMTPILLTNIILIISAAVHPDQIPQVFGIKPVVVLSDSMSPMIRTNDLVYIKVTDTTALNVGDVITFRDEDGTVITHKIKEVATDSEGKVVYQTYGIYNYMRDTDGNVVYNAEGKPVYTVDQEGSYDTWLHAENIEGIYVGKMAGLGGFILWMQGTVGIIVCIGIPLLAFIVYELVRRNAELKAAKTSNENANTELEELRKKLAELESEKDKNS
ncbi:MAG: signal peptidase I [Clostridia bacterium]|nr:signal peptidase I [Clostridia bacterium]